MHIVLMLERRGCDDFWGKTPELLKKIILFVMIHYFVHCAVARRCQTKPTFSYPLKSPRSMGIFRRFSLSFWCFS